MEELGRMLLGIVYREKRLIYSMLIIIFVVWIINGFCNNLVVTGYTFKSNNLPIDFDGYKIAFISDFHCKENGIHESDLISKIKDMNPKMVVFTGDMIDRDHPDITPVKELLEGLDSKYRMYAVDGNHELDNLDNYNLLIQLYKQYGVVHLNGETDAITEGHSSIIIQGRPYMNYLTQDILKKPDTDKSFYILLYHDATAFPILCSLGYDLILAGHTHGGIVRLPIIGGLISTKGTLIAHYESGRYDKNGTTMISSRGIGDAVLPRFYNNPEVICVTLKRTEIGQN